ncbi:MAG: AraC family transcriptional regulator [Thiomicrospira sp.]|jgi:AraC-like DNA-binding protein|nr:AraC family transcriptional regulator [Thiomicrospira sp.]
MMRQPIAPHLLFGEGHAMTESRYQALGELYSHAAPRADFDSKNKRDFFYKANGIAVNDIAIVNSYMTHIRADADVALNAIMLHLSGGYQLNIDRKLQRGDLKKALLVPEGVVNIYESSEQSLTGNVYITFDLTRLNRTLALMAGAQVEPITGLDFKQIQMQYGEVDFKQLFINLIKQIDLFGMNVELLKLNAFDDQVYRLLAMLLKPEHFLAATLSTQDQACLKHNALMKKFEDYIQQHIEEPISLSALQLVLGVSARGLQYACLKHYDCTPREFIRQKKLDYAYELLQKRDKAFTIADIAAQLGFSNQSRFTRYFYERFGVMPSAIG